MEKKDRKSASPETRLSKQGTAQSAVDDGGSDPVADLGKRPSHGPVSIGIRT